MFEGGESYLSLERTKGLRFVMAVLVLLSHTDDRFGYDTGHIGTVAVGVFFFLSAYGLYVSMQTKPDYLSTFLQKRLPSLLVPWWICMILESAIYLTVVSDVEPTIWTSVMHLAWDIFGPLHWFVMAMLTFYVLFYLCFVLFKNRDVAIIMLSVAAYAASILMAMRFSNELFVNYTLSTSSFVMGLLWARFKEPIDAFLSKHRWSTACLLSASAALFLCIFEFNIPYVIYYAVLLFVLMAILLQRAHLAYSAVLLASLAVLMLLYTFDDLTYPLMPMALCICMIATRVPVASRLCSLGGVISFEIFLLNSAAIELVRVLLPADAFWSTMATFAVIIPMAIATWYISKRILGAYNKAYNERAAAGM